MSRFSGVRVFLVIALFVAFNATGCGVSSTAYTPTTGNAKETLNRALTAWQKGEKSDSLEKASPAIHVGDSQWQDGKALESYEILSEEPVPGPSNKMFSVNLKLKGAKSATKNNYIVAGQDPTWVYHEDNFKRLLNMDNNPSSTGKSKKK